MRSAISLTAVFETVAKNFHAINSREDFERLFPNTVESLTNTQEHRQLKQVMPSPPGYAEYLYRFSNEHGERGRIELTFQTGPGQSRDFPCLANVRCQVFLNRERGFIPAGKILTQSLLPILEELSGTKPIQTTLHLAPDLGFAALISNSIVGVCASHDDRESDVSCHLTARVQLSQQEIQMMLPSKKRRWSWRI